jgi:hypothetical protein
MKKLLLLVSCLTFSISLNAQLVNGDFESAATPLLPGIATDSPGWGQGLYTIETTGAYAGAQFGKMKTIYKMSQRISQCTGIRHHVDHVHPLNADGLCGLHVPWNIQVIPARTNLRKKNKLEGSCY